MKGLLALLDKDLPTNKWLAFGQDLTQLGLDLDRPDNSPLWPTFNNPFEPNAPDSRPPVPKFTIPPHYIVNNVPPLHTRFGSFTDETLFFIFYTRCDEIWQELAAMEL